MGVYSMKHEAGKADTTVLSRDGLLWQCCYFSAVLLATRACTNAHTLAQCMHKRSSNSRVRCWHFIQSSVLSRAWVSISVFNMCLTMTAWGRHISILFLSAVCMVCRLELDRACVASDCRATGTMGRVREQWCQTLWERNTQSDIGTARRICLHCWRPRLARHIHAWYNS